jgi:hypothetical protein
MSKKISLLKTKCERCGKELATASRSLWGIDKLKERFGAVCSACITQEESAELIHSMGKAIQRDSDNK